MTKKLLVSFCVLSGFSFGQSFTSANEYAVGESQTMYLCDSAAPSYANVTGSGVTWDYSSYMLVTSSPERTYSVIANPNSTTFPTATKATEIQGILTTIYETNSSGRSIVGLEYVSGGSFGTIRGDFNTDNLHVMDYDFSLNETAVDGFSGTISYTGGSSAATGLAYSAVDGSGTLILTPGVTKTNVIRHHLLDTINTMVFGFIPLKLIIDQYDYYDFAANNLPLFSHVNIKVTQNGNNLSNVNLVLNSEEPPHSVGLGEQEKSAYKVFPNPAGNTLQIMGDLDGSELFTILDISGKTVLVSSSAKVDVSSLQPGAYIVEVEKDGVKSQQKFIRK